MGDVELDPLCELLLTFTEFGTPKTKPVDFDAVIGGNLSFEARELLGVATTSRETMLDGMDNSGHKVDPRNVVASVENYLPKVYKITYSMEQSASAHIKLNKPLEFTWTSVLVKRHKQAKNYKANVLVYEVCFILTIKALAHYNTAKMMLALDNRKRADNMVAAAKELRVGAGILEFVSKTMLPRWVNPPDSRPPEVIDGVVGVLSNEFLCMAQRISVVQAILKGSPPTTIAKLLLGVSERYSNVNATLRKMGDKTDEIFEPVVEEPSLMAALTRAMATKFLGDASYKSDKFGEAVAFLSLACDSMSRVMYSPTMDDMYRAKVSMAQQELDAVFEKYQTDNEKIYFEGVPTRDRLEIPHGSFIIAAVAFELPEVEAVSMASVDQHVELEAAEASTPKAKRKSGGGWFGFGGSKSSSKAEAEDPFEPGPDGKLQAPPGYDKEVFSGLPEDIQREVIAQFQQDQS